MARQKVKIQYGIFSGERRGKRFRKTLIQAGYSVTRNTEAADIIIGHSAGCFWLPKTPTKQRLLLIDPPYWPGKSPKERVRARARSNLQFRQYNHPFPQWLAYNLWGWYYAFTDIPRTRQIMHHIHTYNLVDIIKNHQVIIVRNDDDDWLGPDLKELEHANPNLTIRHIPGDHDDCMFNPEAYVNLLQSL